MARAARDAYWLPAPWMYSTLRASAPPKPPATPATEIARATSLAPPVASEGHAVAPDATIAGATVTEVVPTWQALLDVTVWRSRPWWLSDSIITGGETAKPLTFATWEVLASRVAGRLGAVAA